MFNKFIAVAWVKYRTLYYLTKFNKGDTPSKNKPNPTITKTSPNIKDKSSLEDIHLTPKITKTKPNDVCISL